MDLKQLLTQTTIQVGEATSISPRDSDTELETKLDTQSVIDVGDLTTNDPDTNESSPKKVSQDVLFQQPWNKLEKGMKMNRILLFVKKETDLHELSPALSKELKDILFRGCENGSFNKVSEVKYNEEECMIESLRSLEYNESSKKYKLKSGGTKNRSVSKSRSNIDRLMKKK